MAVGYQYQNDYNEKQESKGFKKKLVILVAGLLLLVVVAIVGAPKKDSSQEATDNNNNTVDKDTSFQAIVVNKNDSSLSGELATAKNISDTFMFNLANSKNLNGLIFDKDIAEDRLVNDVRSEININGFTCEYVRFVGYADYGKLLPSFSYNCRGSESNLVVFIAVKDDKIFNWAAYDYIGTPDNKFNDFIRKVHG